MKKIRVLIIDEHVEVQRALSSLLRTSAHFEVLAVARDLVEGLGFVASLRPDIVIFEPKGRADQETAQAIERIAQQAGKGQTAIVILTSYPLEEEQDAASRAGARRYLLKDIDSARLLSELESVAAELP